MTYFKEVFTAEELKRQYRALCLQYHPDCGGTDKAMAEINAEYEALFATVGNIHESHKKEGETYTNKKEGTYPNDGYREVIDALAGLASRGLITLEICGEWIWIGGETLKYKDVIKATGARWSRGKGMWYWQPYQPEKRYAATTGLSKKFADITAPKN